MGKRTSGEGWHKKISDEEAASCRELLLSAFCFIDKIVEVKKNQSLTASFELKGSEEFLLDHFKHFPVMPGVLLLECLKQAASSLLVVSGDFEEPFFRFISIQGIKFGQFVKPGSRLRILVELRKKEGQHYTFDGRIDLENPSADAKAGRAIQAGFILKPLQVRGDEKQKLQENARAMMAKISA